MSDSYPIRRSSSVGDLVDVAAWGCGGVRGAGVRTRLMIRPPVQHVCTLVRLYLNCFLGPVDANVTTNYPLQSPKALAQHWLGRACATARIFHFGLLGAARHDLHLSPCRMLHVLAHTHTSSLTHTHTIHRDAHTLTRYILRVRAAVWAASKKRMKPGFRRDEQFGTRSASRRECILPQGARADRRCEYVCS